MKKRILLLCSNHLFGEGLATLLREARDMELLGPMDLIDEIVCDCLSELRPNAVILVEEGEHRTTIPHLTTMILQRFPELPIIRAGLDQNIVRVFSAHTLPGSSADLVETIMSLPAESPWEAQESIQNPNLKEE